MSECNKNFNKGTKKQMFKIDTWIIWDKRNWQHFCSQLVLFICIKYWL